MELYYPVSRYFRETYGEKVYKIPVELDVTCPNRGADGRGCAFCSPRGANLEGPDKFLSPEEQIRRNLTYLGRKYNTKLFALYLQNYSATYQPKERLLGQMESLLSPQMVEIYVATRPDCISDAICNMLKKAQAKWGRRIFVELGLQTPNYHTLLGMNRGHTLAEFLDAVLRLHQSGLGVVAHVILDLPGDTLLDAIESAKILTALGVEGVKMHSLYIARGSALEEAYLAGELSPPSAEEYAKRAAAFLAHLGPEVVIHRLAGRIPEALCAADSGESWWKTRDRIFALLSEAGLWQGAQCNYLNGAALRAAGLE